MRLYRQYSQMDYTDGCWADSDGGPASRLLSSSIQVFNRTNSRQKAAAFSSYRGECIYFAIYHIAKISTLARDIVE